MATSEARKRRQRDRAAAPKAVAVAAEGVKPAEVSSSLAVVDPSLVRATGDRTALIAGVSGISVGGVL